MKNEIPRCKGCPGTDRRAKWPSEDPRFCTQRCAAEWAYAMSESERWVKNDFSIYDHGHDWIEF
jgi:hypothetical protein